LARTAHDVHHGRAAHDVHGGNCVAYAREVTGVRLEGNAATWWPHAEGRYERGHKPEVGAIIVFKPYARMHVGHVAVVSRIVSAREVLVDQANWVRGRVTKAMSVIDTSSANDWTSVQVQNGGSHGRDNPTYGFIYPRATPADFGGAVAAAEVGTPHAARDQYHATAADRVASRAKHHKNTPDEEVAAFRNAAPRHVAAHAARHQPKADDTQLATKAAEPAPQHVAHRKPTRDEATADPSAPQIQQVAAIVPPHHKTPPAHDEAKADPSAPQPQQVAAAAPAHHKRKLQDAALSAVY
jgi:surface antigen